jgi:hypothetical protein
MKSQGSTFSAISRLILLLSAMMAMTSRPTAAANEPQETALPDGDGAAIVMRKCTTCHTLDRILKVRRTEAEWRALLKRMAVNGLDISLQDQLTVLRYLLVNFGKSASSHDRQGGLGVGGVKRADKWEAE